MSDMSEGARRIPQRFAAWQEAGPDRELYFDVRASPGKNDPSGKAAARFNRIAAEAGGMVMLIMPCRCLRLPPHRERAMCGALLDPAHLGAEDWLCDVTREPTAIGQGDPELTYIERLQKKIDRMTARQRMNRIGKLGRKTRRPLREAPEFIALTENVSVALAVELMKERFADGTYEARGRQGSKTGPIVTIPPEVFRSSS